MITKFKVFENINNIPDIGDYIKVNLTDYFGDFSLECINFINNNICTNVNYIFNTNNQISAIRVKFYNIPENSKTKFDKNDTIRLRLDAIQGFGKTIEELELKLNSQKYNL